MAIMVRKGIQSWFEREREREREREGEGMRDGLEYAKGSVCC